MIKLKTKMMFVLVFGTILTMYAQKLNFSGVVMESNTKEPIAGVLFVLKDNIIAYTDDNGKFNFNLYNSNLKEDITLTHIGYKSKTLGLKHFKDNAIVELETLLTELEEVSITAKKRLNKKEIIKGAIINYKTNLRRDPFWSNVNLKQTVNYQDKEESYLEIDGNMFMLRDKDDIWTDPVIVPIKTRRTKENFTKLIHSKSMWKNKYNHIGLHSIGTFLYVYRFFERVHPLNKKAYGRFDYSIEKTVELDNEICYLINYKQKKSVSVEGRGFNFMRGQLWVTKNNFKLERITTFYRFYLYKPEKGRDCIFTINYTDDDNILYPENIFYDINNDSNVKSKQTQEKDVYNIKGLLSFIEIDKTIRSNFLNPGPFYSSCFTWSSAYNEYDEMYWKQKKELPNLNYSFSKWIENKDSSMAFKEGIMQKRELKVKYEPFEKEELRVLTYMKRDFKNRLKQFH
jgi:hypothetical protein